MNFIELKQQIIDTINKDGKDLEELISILQWANKKALGIHSEFEDLKNESELNSLENQSTEQ